MERPTFKPIGTPAEQLDTPALVVDVDILEENVRKVHDASRDAGTGVVPSLNAHLSAEVARVQNRHGVFGFAASTVAQAEAFVPVLRTSVFIQNLAVSPQDADRVARLASKTVLNVGADSLAAVALLSEAAKRRSAELGVAIPIRAANSRSIGVAPQDAAALAEAITRADSLDFAGVFSPPPLTLGDRDADSSAALAALRDAAKQCDYYLEKHDPFSHVCVRGSAIYGENAIFDDVEADILIAGSYALGDRRLIERRPEIRPAARILATVMSEQEPGLAWLDAGQKATSIDTGLPLVDGIPGASITRMSAEHGCMELAEGASWDVRLGDKVWLIPHDIANTVNVYDYIHAVQDGKLVDIWRTMGRGGY